MSLQFVDKNVHSCFAKKKKSSTPFHYPRWRGILTSFLSQIHRKVFLFSNKQRRFLLSSELPPYRKHCFVEENLPYLQQTIYSCCENAHTGRKSGNQLHTLQCWTLLILTDNVGANFFLTRREKDCGT